MTTTKVFLDTEFTGLHQKTTLVSLGMISECGKTFYAEITDYDKSQIDGWLQENVIDNLFLAAPTDASSARIDYSNFKSSGNLTYCGGIDYLKYAIKDWMEQFENIEIWSDCLAYDWVLFCAIFGNAFDIPSYVCYIPFDIATYFKIKGINPDVSREEFAGTKDIDKKHNALHDAKIIKACFERLQSI